MQLAAALASTSPAATAVGRTLLLESFDGHGWRLSGQATTDASGAASWRFTLRPGTYRLRVRFAGSTELAPSTSRAVTIRVRR